MPPTSPLRPRRRRVRWSRASAPDFGSTSGGTLVTVNGKGLGDARSVKFGNVKAVVKADSATSITAVAPAEVSGSVYVRIDTAAGSSKAVAASRFTYEDAPPGTVTITPEYSTESCAGNLDTATWVPPKRVSGLTGFYVLKEQFTDEGPVFTDYEFGPDQSSLQFTVVNGETDVIVATITSAGVNPDPFGAAEETGYGIPMPMQWADEGENSVADGSATVAFGWPGPPQASETGGNVSSDTVALTEATDGRTQEFPASLSGDTATFTGLADGDRYTYTATVTDVCGTSQDSGLSPEFVPGVDPSISGTPPAAKVGQPYTYSFDVGGDPVPDLSVSSGQLPPGITLSGSGTLSGTPTTAGDYDVTVTAENDVGIVDFSSGSAAQSFVLQVGQAPSITERRGTTFVVGQSGGFRVESSGFPGPSLSETGALPAGVDFDVEPGGTASIKGAPLPGSNGVYPIVITASNGVSPPATQDFELTVENFNRGQDRERLP